MKSEPKLSQQQKSILTLLLILIMLLLSADLIEDYRNEMPLKHMLLECLAAALVCAGILTIWKRTILPLEKALMSEQRRHLQLSEELANWKRSVSPFAESFSKGIDQQFSIWQLTPAESETALLLLKGFSLREIASIRAVSEKTVKQHNQAIYQKSGMKGRAELSAYFLEDLLGKAPNLELKV